MPAEAYNKVDIVTWLVNVQHLWQEETNDHWANPSLYPFMREVLHESVHFWQAVGLPYFLRVSFAAYKDFQRVRACAFEQSEGNEPIPVDQLQLEPNRAYFLGYQRIAQRYGELSGADIIEGLARYWDIHLCGVIPAISHLMDEGKLSPHDITDAQLRYGPFYLPDGRSYTDAALRFIFDYEARYNRAYEFTLDKVGTEAFILFPVLGFFALSSRENSVSNFQRWVEIYPRTKPFTIPKGHFFDAWQTCFSEAFKWITQGLQEPLYSSLTVYRRLSNRLMEWIARTPLLEQFGPMIGHGVLDPYLLNYWHWMRAEHPSLSDEDVELRLHPTFCLPGIPTYRERLMKWFHPPVILFADGKTWLDEANWEQMTPKVEDQLVSFGGMIGTAMALSGEFPKDFLKLNCPQTTCPWHSTKLCWKVARFPDKPENCIMPNLYRTQMNLDLPTNRDWNAGQLDRPIAKDHVRLLSIEVD